MAVLSYFLECFSVAESRLSRQRELAADQAGASVTNSATSATALVKIHAFSGLWEGFREAAANALREGRAFINASSVYAESVAQSATPAAFEGILETHLSHPTDSHPTLYDRLNSLQTDLSIVSNGALDVTPVNSAITFIPDVERTEETISETYQYILARRLGIDLESDSETLEGGA